MYFSTKYYIFATTLYYNFAQKKDYQQIQFKRKGLMKVLIIEEDLRLNKEITNFFNEISFHTVNLINGLDAIDNIDKRGFDLYIIDTNLHNISGFELIDYIRKTDIDTPIIVIVSSNEIKKLILEYNIKCNEYIKKPFHIKELEIRVNSLLQNESPKRFYFDSDFYYNYTLQQFYYKNKPINLRYKEKRLCSILMSNMGRVVLNSSICDYVWEGEYKEVYPLRQLVSKLRNKLPYNIITTKTKEGYIIDKPKK